MSTSRSTRLVFIGNHLESSKISALVTESGKECTIIPETDWQSVFVGERHLELLAESSGTIFFHLNGSKTTSLSMKEIDERFGVDWDAMNEDLVRSVNSTPGMHPHSSLCVGSLFERLRSISDWLFEGGLEGGGAGIAHFFCRNSVRFGRALLVS